MMVNEKAEGGAGQEKTCAACGGRVDMPDRFCRYCGAAQTGHGAWYYHPASIVLLAVFLLGPFALWLVWQAPRMSRAVRWGLAVFIVVYTVFLCWRLWTLTAILLREWKTIEQLNLRIH
jgi:hypothetical protein